MGINESKLSADTQYKLSPELIEIIKSANENDLIPIWIFQNAIDLDEIAELVYSETGMKREIFENANVLNNYINNAVIQELNLNDSKEKNPTFDNKIASVVESHFNSFIPNDKIKEYKIKETYSFEKIKDQTFTLNKIGGIFSDNIQPIVYNITSELADEYFVKRLNIVNREVLKSNKEFNKQIPLSREVLYVGDYTGTYILRATPAEIKKYASLSDVERISFYDETITVQEERLDWELTGPSTVSTPYYQTAAAVLRDSYGLNGTNVRIGVLDVDRVNLNNLGLI